MVSIVIWCVLFAVYAGYGNRCLNWKAAAFCWEGKILDLRADIEAVYADSAVERNTKIDELLAAFRLALNQGTVRAAEFDGSNWKVNTWIKKGLALCVRFGRLCQIGIGLPIDLDTLHRRQLTVQDQVRVTDSTCFVRDGAFISPGCTLMPHTVIQMGAFIGTDTIIDVGVGIGVCAQIGSRVHINAGAQIHGHIQPLEMLPVIIGDNVSIGANCVIGGGVIVSSGAAILPGTSLSCQTRLYDPIKKQRHCATDTQPLVVPAGAIVVSGVRATTKEESRDLLLGVQVGVIAGYVGERDRPAMVLDRLLDN